MAVVDVVVPAVGESVQEGQVYKWHKANGDHVELDDVLVELETDKATVEIVAEVSGALSHAKAEGDTVQVGDVLGKIDTEAKGAAASAPAPASEPAKAKEAPAAPAAASPTPAVAAVPDSAPPPSSDQPLSPAVSRMVAEHKLDPSQIPGSGRDGRITKTDVVQHMDGGSSAAPALAPAPAPAPASTEARGVRREPMSMIRRRIAERLIEAQHTNAILTTFNEVDMGPVMEMRKQYKESFKEKHGIGLGFMSFFVKASVSALQEYPLVNGFIDGTDVVHHDYYDVGVAISTPRGLMVPVIRDCDKLSFAGIEGAIVDYAQKARAGKIAISDLTGGTFTVTNGGVFGSLVSTPILNPPQSAILGMHKIQERPMVINGEIVARPMMYLALSYDHRIIDGKEAVSFLVKVKEVIEDPSRLLLGV